MQHIPHATHASQPSMRWRISSQNGDQNTSNGVGILQAVPFKRAAKADH